MKNRTLPLFIAISVSAIAMLVLMIGAFTGGLLLAPYVSSSAQAATVSQSTASNQLLEQSAQDNNTNIVAAFEQALIDLYQETLPSVVNIQVTKKIEHPPFDHFDFDSPDPDSETDPEIPPEFFNRGQGSGFVWDKAGHIVTNYHVVVDATDIEVVFADGKTVKAELLGSDPDADLAVIKVDLPASVLTPAALGNSDDLQVGQLSIAIGNPFGQEFTMTSGIISAVGRTIRSGNSPFSIPEVIQTDTPINPGNSGGPLLNRQGEVIGINTQLLSRSGFNSGIGFAVPVNIARQVVPTLIKGETYKYAWLGINGNSLTAEAIEFRNFPPDAKGAIVINVAEDGPADEAGLQGRDETLSPDSDEFRFGGDVITAINGQLVEDMNDLITYLVKETQPGDEVTLAVTHADGEEENVKVTLGVRPTADTLTPEDDE